MVQKAPTKIPLLMFDVSRSVYVKQREWYFKINQKITEITTSEHYHVTSGEVASYIWEVFEISRAGISRKYPTETTTIFYHGNCNSYR